MDSLGGCNGGMHPETSAAQLDDSHAHIGGHIAEAQRLLLLKHPHAAALHLMKIEHNDFQERSCKDLIIVLLSKPRADFKSSN